KPPHTDFTALPSTEHFDQPMNLLKRLRPRFLAPSLGLMAGMLAFQGGALSGLAQEGAVVKSIDVQYVGNQTVAPERILSHMSTRVGDKLSMAQIDEDVKSLYA